VLRPLVFVLTFSLAASTLADTDDALRLARIRLDLAKDVALAKLYSRGPIEDLKREAEVVEKVKQEAQRMGVDPEVAATFFRAQIEASKEAQRAWQAKWAREGAPFAPRPDLAKSVRPKLDELTPQILRALKDALPEKSVLRHRPAQPWLYGAWRTASKPLQR
jgi:chorismate mutase